VNALAIERVVNGNDPANRQDAADIPRAGDDTTLVGLIRLLRDAEFDVGAAELLDAGRLILRLGQRPEGPPQRSALRPLLGPLFCASREEQEKFESVFESWDGGSLAQPLTVIAPMVVPPVKGDDKVKAPKPDLGREAMFVWLRRCAVFVVVALGFVGLNKFFGTTHDRVPSVEINAGVKTTPGKPVPADTPQISKAGDPVLHAGWVWGTLAIPGLLLLGFTLPAYVISRRTAGADSPQAELDMRPLKREAEMVVPELDPRIAHRLERHVRAEAAPRHRLRRRERLDARRTVDATVARMGVPTPMYRGSPIRPSYLMLIDVTREDDPSGRLFYRWAERLWQRRLDVDIRLFTSRGGDGRSTPRTFRSRHSGWRDFGQTDLRLDRLEDPPVGQRLVIVSDAACMVDAQGNWEPWLKRARLWRWPERVLFTPVETRDWGPRENAIERSERTADAGFLVLPLDEAALTAWSEKLVTRTLPDIVLPEPERYPRMLRDATRLPRFALDPLADEPPEDPDQVDKLVLQLRHYLGENGFDWLAACAVAPVIRWELALLIGNKLFARSGIESPTELRYLLVRNWKRLARLPWLRRRHMPDWLRLRLLLSLGPELEVEVRETITELFAPLQPGNGRGLPIELSPRAGNRSPLPQEPGRADALYAGYMSGLSARQLAMQTPSAWRWLSRLQRETLPRAPAWRQRVTWMHDFLVAWWSRLVFTGGVPARGVARLWRWCAFGMLSLWVAAMWWLGQAAPGALPQWLAATVFMPSDRIEPGSPLLHLRAEWLGLSVARWLVLAAMVLAVIAPLWRWLRGTREDER